MSQLASIVRNFCDRLSVTFQRLYLWRGTQLSHYRRPRISPKSTFITLGLGFLIDYTFGFTDLHLSCEPDQTVNLVLLLITTLSNPLRPT